MDLRSAFWGNSPIAKVKEDPPVVLRKKKNSKFNFRGINTTSFVNEIMQTKYNVLGKVNQDNADENDSGILNEGKVGSYSVEKGPKWLKLQNDNYCTDEESEIVCVES